MKLIHIENKIDPNDVVKVMRDAKEDFARELAIILREKTKAGLYPSVEDVVEIMARLLHMNKEFF